MPNTFIAHLLCPEVLYKLCAKSSQQMSTYMEAHTLTIHTVSPTPLSFSLHNEIAALCKLFFSSNDI